jgi:hypothetical protein
MGGYRADTALWFDAKAFRWTSSTFYHPDGRLPSWVVETNAAIEKKKGKQFGWNPEFLKAGGSGWEGGSGGKNRHASWTFGDKEALAGPIGIELTVELAEKAIHSMELGKDAVPDLLAVSLSSHDYLAHDVGPNSQWINALTLFEDKQIARLLNLLRETVPGGLASVVVVLTADHGIPPDPDWLVKQRVSAGRFDEDVVTAELEDRLRKKFGKAPGGKWVAYGGELNFSWEPRVRATEKPGVAALEGEAKRFFAEKPWAAHVVVRSDLEARRYPPELLGRQVARTFVPGRSGDVIVVPKPFYFPGPATVTHVTGYAYDRTIPLVFAGEAFRAGLYGQPADAVDIAPTLAFLLVPLGAVSDRGGAASSDSASCGWAKRCHSALSTAGHGFLKRTLEGVSSDSASTAPVLAFWRLRPPSSRSSTGLRARLRALLECVLAAGKREPARFDVRFEYTP